MKYKRAAKGFKVKFSPKVNMFNVFDVKQNVVYSDRDQENAVQESYKLRDKRLPTNCDIKTRKGSLSWETNDCGVVAHSYFFGMKYELSHSCLKAFGRLDKHGTPIGISMDFLKAAGAKEISKNDLLFLGDLPKLYPKGKYFILIHRHATTMIDGMFYDQWRQRYYDLVESIYTI